MRSKPSHPTPGGHHSGRRLEDFEPLRRSSAQAGGSCDGSRDPLEAGKCGWFLHPRPIGTTGTAQTSLTWLPRCGRMWIVWVVKHRPFEKVADHLDDHAAFGQSKAQRQTRYDRVDAGQGCGQAFRATTMSPAGPNNLAEATSATSITRRAALNRLRT